MHLLKTPGTFSPLFYKPLCFFAFSPRFSLLLSCVNVAPERGNKLVLKRRSPLASIYDNTFRSEVSDSVQTDFIFYGTSTFSNNFLFKNYFVGKFLLVLYPCLSKATKFQQKAMLASPQLMALATPSGWAAFDGRISFSEWLGT